MGEVQANIDLLPLDIKSAGLQSTLRVGTTTVDSAGNLNYTSPLDYVFNIPPTVECLFNRCLSSYFNLTTGGVNTKYNALIGGYPSYIQGMQENQNSGGNPLYQSQNTRFEARCWIRTHISYELAKGYPRLKPVASAAAVTLAQAVTYGEAGSFVTLGCTSNDLASTSLINTYCGAQPQVQGTAITYTAGVSDPVVNVIVPWCLQDGTAIDLTAPVGVNYYSGMLVITPFHQFGDIYATNKYLPFAQPRTLTVTFAPTQEWVFLTDQPQGGANAAAYAVNSSVSNCCLWLDIPEPAVSAQCMALLSAGDIVIPYPKLRSAAQAQAVGVNTSANLPIGATDGTHLRSVMWCIQNTTRTREAGSNINNSAGYWWTTYRSNWNSTNLQQNVVNYYEAHPLLLRKQLQGSVVQGSRDFQMNCVVFDNFTGAKLTDSFLYNCSVGLSLVGQSNQWALTDLNVTTAGTLFMVVETQRYLVLSLAGANVFATPPAA